MVIKPGLSFTSEPELRRKLSSGLYYCFGEHEIVAGFNLAFTGHLVARNDGEGML
jgi:hypothetical protein